jgi:hypothetical protein
MKNVVEAAFCIIGAEGHGAVFLLGNISCKDFVDGTFDGSVTFTTAVSFPWNPV